MAAVTFDLNSFFQRARRDGLKTYQFRSLASIAQYSQVYRTTLRYIRSGDRILDWGSGNGHFSYFLLDRGLKVTSFNFSDDEPEMVKGRPGLTHVGGEVSEPVALPFAPDSFDHVVSIGVLEHVHETGGDQLASLLEVRRVLKRGGNFLCFHFPNRHGWVEKVTEKVSPGSHVHTRKFDQNGIEDLCRSSGLELLEIGRYNFLPCNKLVNVIGRQANTRMGVILIDGIDRLLAAMLPRWTTNYYFVARKQ